MSCVVHEKPVSLSHEKLILHSRENLKSVLTYCYMNLRTIFRLALYENMPVLMHSHMKNLICCFNTRLDDKPGFFKKYMIARKS